MKKFAYTPTKITAKRLLKRRRNSYISAWLKAVKLPNLSLMASEGHHSFRLSYIDCDSDQDGSDGGVSWASQYSNNEVEANISVTLPGMDPDGLFCTGEVTAEIEFNARLSSSPGTMIYQSAYLTFWIDNGGTFRCTPSGGEGPHREGPMDTLTGFPQLFAQDEQLGFIASLDAARIGGEAGYASCDLAVYFVFCPSPA